MAGPDLTDIGERRSVDFMRESLVTPEAELPENYLLVSVTNNDGLSVRGVRLNEDSFSIQMRDSEGRSYSFWKTELKSIEKQRGKSGMPSYKARLAPLELTDLVAYLASLKPSATGDTK